jgi:hypothetical protein
VTCQKVQPGLAWVMAIRGRRASRRARRALDDEQALRQAQFRLGIRLAREALVSLAERLDDSPPWLDGDASTEWKRAADLYAAARAGLRDVTSLAEVLAVHTTLSEARFHLARAEAIGYDEEPPTSPEPLTFDPRRALVPLTVTDQAATSSIQRRMTLHARGAGGYAQGALYAGPPHALPI